MTNTYDPFECSHERITKCGSCKDWHEREKLRKRTTESMRIAILRDFAGGAT
jgi:hypothetical protein